MRNFADSFYMLFQTIFLHSVLSGSFTVKMVTLYASKYSNFKRVIMHNEIDFYLFFWCDLYIIRVPRFLAIVVGHKDSHSVKIVT